MKTVVSESADVPERYLRRYAPCLVALVLVLRLVIPAPFDMGLAVLLILTASVLGSWIACWYLGPKRRGDRLAFLFGLSLANAICLAVFTDYGLRSSYSIFMGLLVLGGIGWAVTMVAGALSMVLSSRLSDRYRVFAREGICVRCGYDLRGSENGRCPECGMPFEDAHNEPTRDSERPNRV